MKRLYQDLNQSDLNPKLKARLLEYKKDALFSYYLATIRRDVPIKFKLAPAKWSGFNSKEVIKLLEKFGFKSLVQRLNVV